MRIIALESIPLIERQHVREGIFRSRRLLTAETGTPASFSLQLVTTPNTYNSPRHRHNFDQVRYQIEGDFDFATDGKMHPGTIAYFPEATPYGPQSSKASSTTLVLQFGGASGSGYIAAEQYERAAAELAKSGSFAKGVYTRSKADGGRINQDAYEAVWEQVNGRPLVYPEPRYARPAFMEPEHFRWMPQPDQPGTARKLLGVFSEAQTKLALYRVDPGAELRLEDHSIYFVSAGAGTVSGKDYSGHTTIHLGRDEAAILQARGASTLLQLGLPRL